jgi:hypothetical protein
LHTLNRAGRLECIDGSAYSPRNRRLARMLEVWSGRREHDSGDRDAALTRDILQEGGIS